MKIGLIGLGKMGLNLALNMQEHNHEVIAYEISAPACETSLNSEIKCFKDLDSQQH